MLGDALQAYNQRFTPDASPTFEEVAAQPAKTFIKPYQGAARWSTYFRFKRPAGSSGKDVKQQLHSARQACLDVGIPLDDLNTCTTSTSCPFSFPECPVLGILEQQPAVVRRLLADPSPTGAAEHYLLGNGAARPAGCWSDFDLRTDNQAITWLKTNRHLNKMFVRWLDEMEDFRFDVTHLPGSWNPAFHERQAPPDASRLRGWARAGGVNGGP